MALILAMSSHSQQCNEISPRLRLLRRVADLTQHQLGKQIGRDAGFISAVERNVAVPSDSDLRALARVLGITVSQLRKGGRPS